MRHYDINKAFVSGPDKFFHRFYQHHAKSPSQIREIEKAKAIALDRDLAKPEKPKEKIWQDF